MSKAISKHQTRRIHSLGLAFLIMGLFLTGAAVTFYLTSTPEGEFSDSGEAFPPVEINYVAPQLSLTDVDGNPTSLEKYRGKVILVNNWATWCPPCKAEMPELEAYYESHSEAGFVVVAIESGEPASIVSNFIQKNGITFPVWLDANGEAVDAFQNWSLPSSYVIDQDGIVRMSWTGQINQATLEKYVTPLLEE